MLASFAQRKLQQPGKLKSNFRILG